jgi:hypothetical protein
MEVYKTGAWEREPVRVSNQKNPEETMQVRKAGQNQRRGACWESGEF